MNTVDYNDFAQSFARSRLQLRWPELEYFFHAVDIWDGIADIACGSWRLITLYHEYFKQSPLRYIWADLSKNMISEAQKIFPTQSFFEASMDDDTLYVDMKKYFLNTKKHIFCIAWLHHITDFHTREYIFQLWYDFLEDWEKVFLTNWALESPRNITTYKNAILQWSKNQFWSHDFSVKIGKYHRWYHSFHLDELEYLAKSVDFTIIENRIFEGEKNIITILQK